MQIETNRMNKSGQVTSTAKLSVAAIFYDITALEDTESGTE
jgi:hypothetical protein